MNAAWFELRTPARRAVHDARMKVQGPDRIGKTPSRPGSTIRWAEPPLSPPGHEPSATPDQQQETSASPSTEQFLRASLRFTESEPPLSPPSVTPIIAS